MTGRGRDSDGAGDDDAELFRRTVADAKPLKKKRTAGKPSPLPPKQSQSTAKPASRAASAPTPRPPAAPPLQVGEMRDLDRRTGDRFRRGKLPIEATLDLHGSYQDTAHSALNGFIADSAAAGKRMLLVVTGKGRVSEGGGVLRRRVPDWLDQQPCRAHVLAVSQARPEHGGSGAYYVLLRRKREGRS